MAKISYIDVNGTQEEAFYGALNPQDRFLIPRVSRKNVLLSRKRIAAITARSYLSEIAELWAGLSFAQKEAWAAAADIEIGIYDPIPIVFGSALFGDAIFGEAEFGKTISHSNKNGWHLFVQDTAYRLKYGISGVATPNNLHQFKVGELVVEDPAVQIKIAQYHPRSYWTSQPVHGKKGMRQPVIVTEDFNLPLVLNINYKSNLVSQGAGSFAKFYAEVRSSYQGIDRYAVCEIPFDLVADWKTATATISTVLGYTIGYTLYIHLYQMRGTLLFDNVKATHNGQNWVRDPFCKDIDQAFTLAFYQVPKHWVAVEIPTGAGFGSIYPDD
jgi:hypothetical protein